MWFGCGNISALMGNKQAANYMVAQPKTWTDFMKGIKELKVQKTPVDAVVIDVLNQLWPKALGDQPTQQDWAAMGNKVRNAIEVVRDLAPVVFIVVDVLPDDEGNDKLDLNRDLYKKIISLFGTKTYCYTRTKRAPKGSNEGPEFIYCAQENGAKALDLRPESK